MLNHVGKIACCQMNKPSVRVLCKEVWKLTIPKALPNEEKALL
jgi:hypothetical protein